MGLGKARIRSYSLKPRVIGLGFGLRVMGLDSGLGN